MWAAPSHQKRTSAQCRAVLRKVICPRHFPYSPASAPQLMFQASSCLLMHLDSLFNTKTTILRAAAVRDGVDDTALPPRDDSLRCSPYPSDSTGPYLPPRARSSR